MNGLRLLLLRHGETEWNRTQRIQGMADVALNELGHRQAERLAEAVSAELGEPFELVSSDLARARDTAQYLAAATGAPLRLDAGIRERHFGVWQGISYAEWRERDAEGVRRYEAGDWDYGPEGGETGLQFFERAVAAVTALARQAKHGTLVLVTHGGVISSFYRHTQSLSPVATRSWRVPNASISEWRFEGGVFRNVRIGDDRFLQESLDNIDP